jgi:hypothetical protein
MMRSVKRLAALAAVLALGLVASGCGGGDDTTTVSVGDETTTTSTEATTTGESTSTTADSTSGSTPDDVYNACLDAIEGTPVEESTKPACAQARDAFQQCIDQANAAGGSAGDTAAQLCQSAADQTIDGLKAAG